MTTASFRFTFTWAGKKPGRLVKACDCEDVSEAVFLVQQWCIWSRSRQRARNLPRYDTWCVERRQNNVWQLVREGTYSDAAQELPQEDSSKSEECTVWELEVMRRQGRRATVRPAHTRRDRGPTRLATLLARKLGET